MLKTGKVNLAAGIETLIPIAEKFQMETGDREPLELLTAAIVATRDLERIVEKADGFRISQPELFEKTGSWEFDLRAVDFFPLPSVMNPGFFSAMKKAKEYENRAREIMGI